LTNFTTKHKGRP